MAGWADDMYPEGVAMVIGGSGGAGSAICKRIAECGGGVALTYRSNKDRAEAVVEELKGLGCKAYATSMTIGDASGVKAAVEEVIKTCGRIHTVVVAAGSDIAQVYISEMTPEQWSEVINQDLNGFYNVVHATLPHMRDSGGGSYVHIGSAGQLKWPERDVLSVAPKAAIEALIQGIAKEEGKFNIRANTVLLGVIETGIFLRLKQEGVFDAKWEQDVLDGLAMKRFGLPEEVADAVVFLSSKRGGYVTGQMISVAGGYGI